VSRTALDGDPGSGSAQPRNTWAQASARKWCSGMELWDATETAPMVEEGGGAWTVRCHMARGWGCPAGAMWQGEVGSDAASSGGSRPAATRARRSRAGGRGCSK
jgi:hypothetical protein